MWISRILTCFEAKALPYSILKGDFFFFLFLLYLHSVLSSFTPVCSKQPLTAKVAALGRTVVNKQNQNHISAEGGGGVTSTEFFWAGDSTELKAKSRRSPLSQTGASGLVGPGGGRRALEGWKGSGAERERHICCTAGRSV